MNLTIRNRTVIVLIVCAALLVANYIYTFGGFVAYTAEDRRAIDMLDVYRTLTENEEGRKELLDELPMTEKLALIRYINQYKASGGRHKTIQQFYLEEAFVVLVAGATLYFIGRRNN